jgi:hypothetical protein
MQNRAVNHDKSKFSEPERSAYNEYVPKLRNAKYGSEEYTELVQQMRLAGAAHHNEVNRHHPEHFQNGIKDMNLIDLIEMICDWKAASERHADGNIYKSIEINQERFKYSDEVKYILKNTVDFLYSPKINSQER